MNNKEVAHQWAHQTRDSAKGSNMYFEGDTIYSYGSHFPMARHVKGVVLFNDATYSVTTSKHQSYTSYACHHMTVFKVPNVESKTTAGFRDNALTKEEHRENAEYILSQAMDAAGKAKRARLHGDWHAKGAIGLMDSYKAYCRKFGVYVRKVARDDDWMNKLAEIEESNRKARRVRERKAQAKREKEALEAVAEWIRGERRTIPGAHLLPCKLRRVQVLEKASVIETSHGARIPYRSGKACFVFAQRVRKTGWHRNGQQFKVGDYHLDAVNSQGIVAGCHKIKWEEIERFAAQQGW